MGLSWNEIIQDPSWNLRTPEQQMEIGDAFFSQHIQPSPEWLGLTEEQQKVTAQKFADSIIPYEEVGFQGAFVQGLRHGVGSTIEGAGAVLRKVGAEGHVSEALEAAGEDVAGEQKELRGIGEKFAFGLGSISMDIATAFIPVGGAVGLSLKGLSRVPKLAAVGRALTLGKPVLQEFGKTAATFAGVGALKGAPEDRALAGALENAALSVPFGLSALPARYLARSLKGAIGMGLGFGAAVGGGTALVFGGDQDDVIANALLFAGLNALPHAGTRERLRKLAEENPDMSVGDLATEAANQSEALGDADGATQLRKFREDLKTSYHMRDTTMQEASRNTVEQSLNALRPEVREVSGAFETAEFDRAMGKIPHSIDVRADRKSLRDYTGRQLDRPEAEFPRRPTEIIGVKRDPSEPVVIADRHKIAKNVPGFDRTAAELLQINMKRVTGEQPVDIFIPENLRRKMADVEPLMKDVSEVMSRAGV